MKSNDQKSKSAVPVKSDLPKDLSSMDVKCKKSIDNIGDAKSTKLAVAESADDGFLAKKMLPLPSTTPYLKIGPTIPLSSSAKTSPFPPSTTKSAFDDFDSKEKPIDTPDYELVKKIGQAGLKSNQTGSAGSDSADSHIGSGGGEHFRPDDFRQRTQFADAQRRRSQKKKTKTPVDRHRHDHHHTGRRKAIGLVITIAAFVIGAFCGMGIHYYAACRKSTPAVAK